MSVTPVLGWLWQAHSRGSLASQPGWINELQVGWETYCQCIKWRAVKGNTWHGPETPTRMCAHMHLHMHKHMTCLQRWLKVMLVFVNTLLSVSKSPTWSLLWRYVLPHRPRNHFFPQRGHGCCRPNQLVFNSLNSCHSHHSVLGLVLGFQEGLLAFTKLWMINYDDSFCQLGWIEKDILVSKAFWVCPRFPETMKPWRVKNQMY